MLYTWETLVMGQWVIGCAVCLIFPEKETGVFGFMLIVEEGQTQATSRDKIKGSHPEYEM